MWKIGMDKVTYDGASNISSGLVGVQVRIKEKSPLAAYGQTTKSSRVFRSDVTRVLLRNLRHMYVAIYVYVAINMYHVSVCHRLLSCVVRSRPVIVYLVPMQRIFITTYLVM